MAPPAPSKLWQAVQLVRKIWPPRTIASSRSSLVESLDRVVLLGRDGGPGAQRGDERRRARDLLLGVGHRLARGLRAGLGHAASGRCRPGSRRRRRRHRPATGRWRCPPDRVDALAVLAVAERAADEEELAALRDVLGVALGLLGLGRGERGVEAAGDEQAEQQHHEAGDGSATVPGEATGGSVQETHVEILTVRGVPDCSGAT